MAKSKLHNNEISRLDCGRRLEGYALPFKLMHRYRPGNAIDGVTDFLTAHAEKRMAASGRRLVRLGYLPE
jgi:hypothetical protein